MRRLILVLIAVTIVCWVLIQDHRERRHEANRAVCFGNARQLSTLALLYHDIHGRFPQTVQELLRTNPDVSWDIAICPSSDHYANGEDSSYEFRPGAKYTDGGNAVLLRETEARHGSGRVCAFVDGHIEWVEASPEPGMHHEKAEPPLDSR